MKRITDSQGKNKQNRASEREGGRERGDRATEQKSEQKRRKEKKGRVDFQPALK